MNLQFADRLNNVETSAIRELFKLLGKPGIISFAGGFPDSALFDVQGIRQAADQALSQDPGAALQYGATEGHGPLREQLAQFMTEKGVKDLSADQLIVTTGSQQALDLMGKTMIGPGDKVIVEGPTFLATIQCFRLYGANLISAPVDAHGVQTDALEKLIVEHRPKFVYIIPTFGNPTGALLSAERRKRILELAVQYQTLIVEDDPYGDLYFGQAPPPSLLAMTQLPIAIAPFRGEDLAPQKSAAIVLADLERSGQFRGVDSAGLSLDESSRPDMSNVRQRNADALLAGSVQRLADGRYEVRARLWDTVKGQERGDYKESVNAADLRLSAHRLADWVYEKLTGEKGVFATRIAYITKSRQNP